MRNAAMEIYVKMGPAAGARAARAPARRRRGGPQLRRRDARGAPRDGRRCRPLIAALADRRRQRAPRRRGQPGPDRRRREAVLAARSTSCAPSPGCSTRPSTPWARSATRARRRRCSSCSATSCCAAPVMEALGPPGRPRGAARTSCPTSTTPTRRCATWPSTPWWPSSSARPPPARASTPTVQAALRREDLVDHLLRHAARRTTPSNRRTAAVTLGWLKEPRAERPLIELPGRAGAPGVRHPRPRLHRLPGPRRPTRCGLDHPDDAVRQGTIRCLAWIAPPGGIDLVAPAHPRPVAGGARRGRRRHRPPGRRGRGHAALRAARRRERAHPGERDGRARAHARRSAWCRSCCRPWPARRSQVRVRAAETLGPPARSRHRARAHRALPRPARDGAPRRHQGPGRDRRRRACPTCCAPRSSTRAAWCASRRCVSLGKLAGPGDGAPTSLPLLDDPDPKMRFVTLRALGQIRNRRGGAPPACRSSPTRARSCASPRWRPWARCARWRRCGR